MTAFVKTALQCNKVRRYDHVCLSGYRYVYTVLNYEYGCATVPKIRTVSVVMVELCNKFCIVMYYRK